ncbi:NAD synthetase / Glutamine amidotransferase chain of NAD synthetase [hydrothermal vent metagenome]|uniref:NAD(+) synthase (glutamine-hydrolyzing) n=1 Tax=hydrothermal vent metagenome TaxID=652676 RepID=A0A3B0UC83_9ZZZZ
MLRIALAQINPTVGDLNGNYKIIIQRIKEARKKEADCVVFPEMAICGYPPEDLLYKDHFVKDNLKILKKIVSTCKDMLVIVGFVDQDKSGHLYNAAALINNGVLAGVYHKEELPNYGVFDEKRYFSRGVKNKTFKLNKIPLSISICEDIWINQGSVKKQSFEKIPLFVNISCSPFDIGKAKLRERLLKERAKKAKGYICYVNLVGGQDELVFDGGSLIVDPKGSIVAQAKSFEEDLLVVDLLIKGFSSRKTRTPLFPLKEKKEIQIERIYKALVLGTRDYVQKNGFKKVLIGISGGIDSALVTAVAVDSIGKDNVVGVTMPSDFTSKGTYQDSKKLSENFGIKLYDYTIKDVFNSYQKLLSKGFKGLDEDVTEENLQARIRGNILMALSNKFGWLVLTTGNKSEFAVGYCTLYGDMSGGFAVIKDVPKTKVYELAKFRNRRADSPIVNSIIDRAPSAELRKNQKDQDSLPAYDLLDGLLSDYVQEHKSVKKMAQRDGLATAKRIVNLVDYSEYKRRQAPIGIKITPRAFGRDWRLPITNKYKEF